MKGPAQHLLWGLTILVLTLAMSACRQRDGKAVAPADRFPRKPLKVVVPFPAGGGSDTFTRIMQKAIRDANLLPQPMVVINVPGAGGTVGSRRVRDAKPDGYTILNLHEGIFSSKYSGRVPFGPEAFRPIAATGQSALVICVQEDSPYRSLKDLMEAATNSPDRILFGMAQGAPTHFVGRKLELAAGDAKFRFVASGGGSKRFNDLIGGHLDATPFSMAEYTSFSEGGVRALASLAAERHPDLPDLPTAREDGYDVVMTHVQYWWAPKSTPGAAVQELADALEAALRTDYVRGKLKELKIEPLFLRGQPLDEHLSAREADFRGAALVRYQGLPDPVVPVVVAVLMLMAMVVARALPRKHAPPAEGNTNQRYLAVTLGVLAAYVLAMQIVSLPYAVATAGFIPLMGMAAGARSRRGMILLAGVGALLAWGCFFLFTEVLVIDLP
jgi:tripartite-type tricarboxylate transporter receptor subunit TctC